METFLTKKGTGGWNSSLTKNTKNEKNWMIVLRLRTERNRSRTERLGKKEQEQNDQAERFKKKSQNVPSPIYNWITKDIRIYKFKYF